MRCLQLHTPIPSPSRGGLGRGALATERSLIEAAPLLNPPHEGEEARSNRQSGSIA